MATGTGREPPELDTTTPDPGLFGPDSVSWRIHDDPAALVGGMRALMLQSLLPGVMHGFYVSTDARADPWGRLWRTANYVNVVVYGTKAEARAYSERVRRMHRALRLDRPEWLLWVHCAAVDSWLCGHRASGAALTATDADRYVSEQVVAAGLVGIDLASAPASVADLRDYLGSVRPQLQVTAEAREAVRDVLWPPMGLRTQLTTPARPLWTWAASTAFGLLPRWARRMFGLPGLPITDLGARLSAHALRRSLLLVPRERRTSPHVRAACTRLSLPPP